MKRRDIKNNEGNLENMAQSNKIFTDLYYFLEFLLVRLQTNNIVNLKPKWLNPHKSMNSSDWSIILGGRLKFPSENRQPLTNHTMIV